jgi:type II secretory pathway component PulM
VAELASLHPDRALGPFLDNWQREGSFERALRRTYGMSSLDFERHWRGRVRRQYGALALAADLSLLSIFLTLLLGPMWWQRRQRIRRKLEWMREADAAQELRERESALTALLGEVVPDPRDADRIKGS